MKAIAYVRWSTDDQTAGNSLERQTANAADYCQRNGLELAETLVDDGFSAFKGHHVTKGAFGRFLVAADKGEYRGYALVVEQMDRLSRQGIAETFRLTERLLSAELEIHITQQNRVIRSLDDLSTVIMHAVESYSAQEYSKKLKERVSAAWRNKKANANGSGALTATVPHWLRAKLGQPIEVIPERAAIVKEIFRLYASGIGHRLIARELNKRGQPTWGSGKAWQHSYIQKILCSRAVIGEYQPCKRIANGRRVADGEPVSNYYPRIISDGEWLAAHTRTKQSPGQVGSKISNLFKGLVRDAELDCVMNFQNHGAGRRYLTSDSARLGIKPHRINYDRFESNFLRFLDQLDWTTVLEVADSSEIRQTEEKLAHLKLDIERTREQTQKIVDLLVDTPSRALKERLQTLEADTESKEASLQASQNRLEDLRRKHRDLLDESVVYSKLARTKDFETRAKLRAEIRKRVARIDLYFDGGKALKMRWEGEAPEPGFTAAVVHFVNGVIRIVLFLKSGETYLGGMTPKDKTHKH